MSIQGKKILVVRVGRAGDMVMITPALNMILEGYPGAEVHLLTTADGRRVLKGFHPAITRTFLYSRRIPRNWWLKPRIRRDLAAEGYDRIFSFETNAHYHDLLQGLAPSLHEIENLELDVHYCVRCLEVVESQLSPKPQRGWLKLPVTAQGIEKADSLLQRYGIGSETILVGLHTTFSGMTLPAWRRARAEHRTWPKSAFADLARKLSHHALESGQKTQVIADVLPEERSYVEELVQLSGGAVTLMCEAPDFERYKGLLSRMSLLVTPDTGPMHIAAALGVPLVALFSGKSPLDCGPFVPPEKVRILQAEKSRYPEKGLAGIEVDSVFDACMNLLKNAP